MKFFMKLTLVVAALALTGATLASAQPFGSQAKVERSGRVYHVKVCPGPDIPGRMRCHAHVVTDSRGNILTFNPASGFPPSGFGPATLRAAYGITGVGSPATTVAIVDAYGYPNAAADLAVYRAQFGLPPCTTTTGCLRIVNENGGYALPRALSESWDLEQALDLDMVSTMCPKCRILLVEASAPNGALYQGMATAASLGAHVISDSWGGNESGTSGLESYTQFPGVAVIASTGDNGYGVQFPASSPYVIAAGGTSLTMNGSTWGSEVVWPGAGSGCSTQHNTPTWQVGTAANSLCKMRMVADVSAVADPGTGVAVYGPPSPGKSAWMVVGGTSAAAPLIGGIYGEKANPVSYASGLYAAPASAFHDITSGANGSCGGTYYCTGEVGYDGPTGLGTPKGDTAF